MWRNSGYAAYLIGGVIALVIWGFVHSCVVDGRTLWPTTREIIVREVANGYIVEARVKNSPYPYTEYVFTDRAMVGSAVAGLLNERIPEPQWGK